MTLQHLRWGKLGRTFRNTKKPNEFVYLTSVRALNVFDEADQEWKPYIWDAPNLYYAGDACVDLSGNWPKFKKGIKFLTSKSSFQVQQETSPGVWENVPHGSPTRNIKHNFPEEGYFTAYLNFPDAQYDLQIGFRTGRKDRVQFGFRFRAPKSGRVRFLWKIEGIEKPAVGDFGWIKTGAAKGPQIKTGIRFKNFNWRWSVNEAESRTINVTGEGNKRNLEIIFGPYDYIKNTWFEVSPDSTTLEAGYSADVHEDEPPSDCYPSDDSDWIGRNADNEFFRTVNRWDVSGIDAGWDVTKVESRVYVEAVKVSPGPLQFNRYGTSHGEDNPQTDCGNGGLAFTKCDGTEYAEIVEPSTGWTAFVDLGATACTDVEWCRDNASDIYSVGLTVDEASGGGERLEISEYDEGNDAELKITYSTEAAKYSLVCDAGSFAETGVVTDLLKSSLVSADTDAYALTGQTVDLAKSMEIDAGAGSYALTGQLLDLLKSSLIVADPGAYALTGLDVDVIYTELGGRKKKTNFNYLMRKYYGREVSTMYVMQCVGGYAVPLKGGRYQVVGMRATVSTTTTASRVVLCDDSGITEGAKWGRFLDGTTPYNYTTNVVDTKGIANVDGYLEVLYPEPLQVRHGLSAVVTDNIIPGSLIVYIR